MHTDAKPILLLVEDSEDDAYFFRRALEKARVVGSVQRALNGAEAVEFLQNALSGTSQLPRAMFLDLKMPVLNGFEVLEWLGTQNVPASMPVIVLSGSEHEEDKARATRLGAAAYVVKPIRAADFHRFLPDLCPQELGARV
jgi:CheY-like chemotaxis protein